MPASGIKRGIFYAHYGDQWILVRRIYFWTYVIVSLVSAIMLIINNYFCTSEDALQCVSEDCAAKQELCKPLQGAVKVRECCYNGEVMPCHHRFWFVMVNWVGLFFTILNQFIQHECFGHFDLEEALDSKETLVQVQDCSYVLRTFTDKVGVCWATIILLQAYLAPDPFGYLGTLIDGSVCVQMFNFSFSTQLFFVAMDQLTTIMTFVSCQVIALIEPVSADKALETKLKAIGKPASDGTN